MMEFAEHNYSRLFLLHDGFARALEPARVAARDPSSPLESW